MVHDPLRRKIIERGAVARAAATRRLGRIVRFRRWRWRRHRLMRQQRAAEDWPLHMRSGPNLAGPVDGFPRFVQHRFDPGHVRGADRFKAKLLLTPPLYADA